MTPCLFLCGLLLLAAGISSQCAWMDSRVMLFVPLKSFAVTAVAGTVGNRIRPYVLNDWIRIRLDERQRQIIRETYDNKVLVSGFRPHLQLEIFIEMVRNTPADRSLPMFMAQQEPVLRFAHDHQLDWLTELLTQKTPNPCDQA